MIKRRNRFRLLLALAGGALTPLAWALPGKQAGLTIEWSQLPELPDSTLGFGGPFAGVHHGALLLAGGANFPDGPPWTGAPKVWHDEIYLLEKDAKAWRVVGKLQQPLAYGASVSTSDGVILLGGCDAERAYADVVVLQWDSETQQVTQKTLPSLPKPSAFHAAVLVDSKLYVLAGQQSADPTDTLGEFWVLDLAVPAARQAWRQLPPLPGKARIKTVMAAQTSGSTQKYIYVFSGEIPTRGATEDAVDREYPADAWRFDPAASSEQVAWKRLASPPQPIAAGSAIEVGQSQILTFSGSTGRHIHEPVQERPPFPTDVLSYHTITDAWAKVGEMPTAVVTTSLVRWGDQIVIPSGEMRPGVRTRSVQAATISATKISFGWVNYSILGIYLALLVAMGFYFAGREKSTQDFFLAGGRIPWWAAGLSIFATMLSAITYLAIPARTFATDWVYFPLNCGILLVVPVVAYVYLPFFRRLNVTTAYEYLEQRFDLSIRLFASASFIVYQLGRMGVVVLLPALALSAVTGIDIAICIILMGGLTTLYTALGGIEAVIWTDVVQTVVLLGGAIAAVFIIVSDLPGGFGQLVTEAIAQHKFTWVHMQWDFAGDSLPVIALSLVFLNIVPYTSDQAVIQRYLTTRDEQQAARAIWTNGILAIPASILFFAVGTALFVYFKVHPAAMAPIEKADQVFPWFVAQRMPAGLAGLVIAGIFAAAMSSLDSGIHSISTAVTTDFLRRFWPKLSEHTFLKFAQWLTVVLGALGTGTALLMLSFEIKFLWDLFLGIVGLLLGTVGGLFMLGIFTQRPAAQHAWVGILVSIIALGYTKFATDLNGLLYAPIGMLTCAGVGYLMSLVFPATFQARAGLTIYSVNRAEPPASSAAQAS